MSMATRYQPKQGSQIDWSVIERVADHQRKRARHIEEATRKARHPNRFHRFWQQLTKQPR